MRASTHREVASIERMDNKRLVAHVDNSADPIARVEGSGRSGVVFDCTVVVAVLYLLQHTTHHTQHFQASQEDFHTPWMYNSQL